MKNKKRLTGECHVPTALRSAQGDRWEAFKLRERDSMEMHALALAARGGMVRPRVQWSPWRDGTSPHGQAEIAEFVVTEA